MALIFYGYPKCGTCQKAKKWLDTNDLDYTYVNLVDHPPAKQELLDYIAKSGLPAKKFFNTSGKRYREQSLKDKINDMPADDMAELLASDGMLIKRPIVTDGDKVTVGFNEETFTTAWL